MYSEHFQVKEETRLVEDKNIEHYERSMQKEFNEIYDEEDKFFDQDEFPGELNFDNNN